MGNSASALPYTIGNETHPSTRPGSYGFSIHSGDRKSDQKPVTVFKGEKTKLVKTPLIRGANVNDPNQTQIFPALHHFKKCKTLIHPHILSVYATLDTDHPDGNDPAAASAAAASAGSSAAGNGSVPSLKDIKTTGDIIIVTEHVMPLDDYLDMLEKDSEMTDKQREDAIAWGIYTVIQAVNFLHAVAKVAHGNLTPNAIYVTPGGDFKLSSFHILTPVGIADGATGPTQHFRTFERDVTPKDYRGPERIEGRFDAISTSPVHAMDSYAFGELLPEIYRHYGAGTSSRLPQKLEKACARMRTVNITSRPRILPLSKCPIFNSAHVQAQKYLDEIATQPIEGKISFWRSLPDLFQNNVLCSRTAKYKILPLLQQTITNLTAMDMGLTQEISRRECLALLPTLFTTATSHLSSAEFQTQLAPLIELLFKVNDRAVRGAMLGRISMFSDHLDTLTLNRVVFEPMCSGFTDSSAPLRELTLKSAIALVSHLSQPNLEKLSRYLVRMQGDSEDSIRTNAVIFIGKVAPNLTDVAKSKLILPAFMRSMADGFVPCRLAGMKAIGACRTLFDEKRLASEVLPAIVPSLMDGNNSVRDAAMQTTEEILAVLREAGEKMRLEEAKLPKTAPTVPTNGYGSQSQSQSSINVAASATAAPTTAAGASSASSSYLSGFGSWAASKIVTSSKATDTTSSQSAEIQTSMKPNNAIPNYASAPVSSTQPISNTKPSPAFSSLSLRDAGVGGASTGWSDDEFDDAMPETNSMKQIDGKKNQKSLIPSFATDGDDDFMSQFDKKSSMRPRGGMSTKLKTPARIAGNARRREELTKRKFEKKEKPGVMKLSLDKDTSLDNGWDDF